MINNITYRGNLDAEDVFEALCAGFEHKPEECEIKRMNLEGLTHGTFVLVIAGFTVLLVLAICLFRRYMKREMQSEMNMAVNSAVSQYFALSNKD